MNGRQLQLIPSHRSLHAVRTSAHRAKTVIAASQSHRARLEPLWYAIHLPQLAPIPDADRDERANNDLSNLTPAEKMAQIAHLLGSLSSTVSIVPPDCLVFEIRSSLNYFGGIEKIRSQLSQKLAFLLRTWGLTETFTHAASPTPDASLLLARAGCNLLIYHRENLRSALGRLPLQVMPLSADKRKQLHNTGLRVMRDLWRLPSSALAQRFGLGFVKQLDRCLGRVANPIAPYQAAPVFNADLEFEYPLETTKRLAIGVEELITRLGAFLRQRELAVEHVELILLHEQRGSTVVNLALRQAARSTQHLQLLLETQLNSLQLSAPVLGLRLEAKHFAPFTGSHSSLTGITPALQYDNTNQNIIPLLEQLQARLGINAVRSINSLSDHCPEAAGQDYSYGVESINSRTAAKASVNNLSVKNLLSRPCWLLSEPVQLTQVQGKLHYRSSVQLLRGPERIETHWWTGKDIRRDYYVARNQQGMRLWIFHERSGERHWFLHGIFD